MCATNKELVEEQALHHEQTKDKDAVMQQLRDDAQHSRGQLQGTQAQLDAQAAQIYLESKVGEKMLPTFTSPKLQGQGSGAGDAQAEDPCRLRFRIWLCEMVKPGQ